MSFAISHLKKWIPSDFNRKLRPISELLYWKATEFRLFTLYTGVVILKDKQILSKCKYKHFLNLSVAMRILLTPQVSSEQLRLCYKCLCDFVENAASLYGKGFVSYNVHSLIHLVDDYWLHGCLELVSAFTFESYLGILKNSVRSGYKSFHQVVQHVFKENSNCHLTSPHFVNENKFKEAKSPGLLPAAFIELEGILQIEKATFVFNCAGNAGHSVSIKPSSLTDSTISFNSYVYKVINLVKYQTSVFLVVRKYVNVKEFFSPISSKLIGIYKVSNLSDCIESIEMSWQVKKCILLPYKKKFIACELLHTIMY